MTPTPAEIYKAILEGAEYEHLDVMHTVSVEEALCIGREVARRTKNLLERRKQLAEANATLLEALKLTLMNAKAPDATDWPAVVERLERVIAQAEGGGHDH